MAECCLDAEVFLTITRSSQRLCQPTYQPQKLLVTTNMSQPSLVPAPGVQAMNNSEPWNLSNIHPWDIAVAQFETYQWAELVEPPSGFSDWGSGPSVEVARA